MARGIKKEVAYTGAAAKTAAKIEKLESSLKELKLQLKAEYAQQLKDEKMNEKKHQKEMQCELLKVISASTLSPEEIISLIQNKQNGNQ